MILSYKKYIFISLLIFNFRLDSLLDDVRIDEQDQEIVLCWKKMREKEQFIINVFYFNVIEFSIRNAVFIF